MCSCCIMSLVTGATLCRFTSHCIANATVFIDFDFDIFQLTNRAWHLIASNEELLE